MRAPKPKKLKSGKYRIQVQVNHNRYSITKDTAKECRREWYEYKAGRISSIETVPDTVPTLSEVIDNYISSRKNVLSASTIAGYERIKRNHFQEYMELEFNSDIDWQKAVNEAAQTTGAKTLKNAWGLVHSALKYAGISIKDVTLPKVPKTDRPFLEPDQIFVFLEAIRGHRNELAFILALHSLRFSELRALEKINVQREKITVRGARVRNEYNNLVYQEVNKTEGSRRDVPILIPRLVELVKEAASDKYLVEWSESTVRNDLMAVCEKAGLPVLNGIHCLRHTFASLCYHLKVPELEAARIGGWSDLQTMHKIYTHLAEIDKIKAAKQLKDFFLKSQLN